MLGPRPAVASPTLATFLRLVVGVIATLTSIAVGFVTPVVAAGSKAIIIEGPGLDGPREIDFGSPPPGVSVNQFELAAQLGAWFNARAEDVVALRPKAPTDDLGPRWTVTWIAAGPEIASREDRSTRQHVYPDAAGGPLVHTPDGQGVSDVSVGWYEAPRALRGTLRTLGVPLDDGDRSSLPRLVPFYGSGVVALAALVWWRASASRKRKRHEEVAAASFDGSL